MYHHVYRFRVDEPDPKFGNMLLEPALHLLTLREGNPATAARILGTILQNLTRVLK